MLRRTVPWLLVAVANCGGGAPETIHEAAKQGDTRSVEAFLAAKPELLDSKDHYGRTPLHWAAWHGHTKLAEALIARGADLKVTDKSGATPLHFAVSHERRETCELLLARGADPNSTYEALERWTPLHLAVHRRNKEIITVLIKRGADLNVRSKDGGTPLHVALRWGDTDTAKLLLEHKAEVDLCAACALGRMEQAKAGLAAEGEQVIVKRVLDWTPLHWAARYGHIEIARLLLSKGADAKASSSGWTPLHSAGACGSVPCIRLLLDAGADVNAASQDGGRTALDLAAQGSHVEAVKELLAKGARLDAHWDHRGTPLHRAAERNDRKLVEILLAAGADINSRTRREQFGGEVTPLFVAVAGGRDDVAKLLIGKGADVNARSAFGSTPLHSAAALGNLEMVKLLIEKGADVNPAQQGGFTPLDCAQEKGHREVVDFLKQRGGQKGKRTPIPP